MTSWQIASWLVVGAGFVFGILDRRKAFSVLLVLLPFYAFLITYLAHLLGAGPQQMNLVRLVKEGLLAGIFLSLLWIWWRKNKKVRFYLSDFLIAIYFLVLIVGGLLHHSTVYELLFGLRYNFLFLFAYVVFRLYFSFFPQEKDQGLKLIFWTAIAVFIFALLQFFVLPKDFLVRFGYIREAMATFDPTLPLPAIHWLGNSGIARVQSFFAGPNQLASFCLLVLFLALGARRHKIKWLSLVSGVLALLVLLLTFSRSAWVGGLVGMMVFFLAAIYLNTNLRFLVLGIVLGILGAVAYFFKNQLFDLVVRPSSSAWHWVALRDAWHNFISTPWGVGLGKVGPASQWLKQPFISENYYLQIAIESGWQGLASFCAAAAMLLWELWQKQSVQARTVFCLFLSLLVSSFFLHSLADGVLGIYLGLALAWGQTEEKI